MTNINNKKRVDALEVLKLPDDDAVHWIKDNGFTEEAFFFVNPEQEFHKVMSFAFARRPSKRVRLAVARYGTHILTLQRLFKNGSNSS